MLAHEKNKEATENKRESSDESIHSPQEKFAEPTETHLSKIWFCASAACLLAHCRS